MFQSLIARRWRKVTHSRPHQHEVFLVLGGPHFEPISSIIYDILLADMTQGFYALGSVTAHNQTYGVVT